MGMQLSKKLNNGLDLPNVYARIDSLNGSKKSIIFSLNYYASRKSFIEGNQFIQQERYTFTPSVEKNSENIFKQGYLYLKTLDEFKDAIAVFEEGQV